MLRSALTLTITLALNVAIIVFLGLLLFGAQTIFGQTGTNILNIRLASLAAGAFIVLRLRRARAAARDCAEMEVSAPKWHEFTSPLTIAIFATTTVISVVAWQPWSATPDDGLLRALALDPAAVARGEVWRLLTVALVHANIMHLLMNLGGLALVDLVLNGEQTLGKRRLAVVYLGGAVAASVASMTITGANSVGASGALMALLAALYFAHRDLAARTERWMAGAQELALNTLRGVALTARKRSGVAYEVIMLTLLFGLSAALIAGLQIDNAAHSGGVLSGAVLYLLMRRRSGKH